MKIFTVFVFFFFRCLQSFFLSLSSL